MTGHTSNSDNSLPLHKTVHWRKFKEILKNLCNYEQINLNSYCTDNIICYTTTGDTFQGRNVNYKNKNNYSCFVSNNTYDIFEIASKGNSQKNFGEYLFVAHNKNFNYWLFGKISDKLNVRKTKEQNRVIENVIIDCFGYYEIVFKSFNEIKIFKSISRDKTTYRR